MFSRLPAPAFTFAPGSLWRVLCVLIPIIAFGFFEHLCCYEPMSIMLSRCLVYGLSEPRVYNHWSIVPRRHPLGTPPPGTAGLSQAVSNQSEVSALNIS